MTKLSTPDKKSVEEVAEYLKVDKSCFAKTIIYESEIGFIAALVRGDREINERKLKKAVKIKNLFLAKERDVEKITGAPCGFAGPFGLNRQNGHIGSNTGNDDADINADTGGNILIVIDEEINNSEYWITGANEKDWHMANVKPGRDFNFDIVADIRSVQFGDKCVKCQGILDVKNAIELGHIFKLGEKYSKVLSAKFLDEKGESKYFVMGCYGIGVGRTLQTLIEVFADENGINLPVSVSPFALAVVNLNVNDEKITEISEKIYGDLTSMGADVLYDDRKLSAGIKLKDIDLIGIPFKIVIGNRTVKENKYELEIKKDSSKETFDSLDALYSRVKQLIF